MLFLINCTLQHFLIAEFGCLASFWNLEITIPFACELPSRGSAFSRKPSVRFLYAFCRHLNLRLLFSNFRALINPMSFSLEKMLFKCVENVYIMHIKMSN